MMKKRIFGIIAIGISAVLIVGLAACGNADSTPASAEARASSSSKAVNSVAAHEHTWKEANFQEAKTCEECGETEGEPLTPAFEEAGYTINMTEVGTPYQYKTSSYRNPSVFTTGTVIISNYSIVASDETHEAIEGFEWRFIDLDFQFFDDNALAYGYLATYQIFDYYQEFQESPREEEVNQDFNESVIEINYYGEDIDCILRSAVTKASGWEGPVGTISIRLSTCVPIGYDGMVLRIHNSAYALDENANLLPTKDIRRETDEDTLFFRLENI